MGELDSSGKNVYEEVQLSVEEDATTFEAAENKICELGDTLDFSTALAFGFEYLEAERNFSSSILNLLTFEGEETSAEAELQKEMLKEIRKIEASAKQGLYGPARAFFQRLSQKNLAMADTFHFGKADDIQHYRDLSSGFEALVRALPPRGLPFKPE